MALILAVYYWSTFISAFFLFSSVNAQNISTDLPVPPLQWLNLSSSLRGSWPPPLKDAAIGYDETSRSIVIFGGESAGGFVQSQTYLLNLDTLTWSTPSPPAGLGRTPAARSATVAGGDSAASYRHGFVVIGGRGTDGNGLSDVWEYDFNNQFWSQVNVFHGPGPLPRWGASGGIDILTPPVQDPLLSGPNNTLYVAGGFNGTQASSLSDVWRLHISGTLSPNLPNYTTASWDHLTIGNLPTRAGQAGAVISQQIISMGGCNLTFSIGCTQEQDSYVVDVQRQVAVSPKPCPAPRTSPVLVPNMNRLTTSFSSQVYLLLGTVNTSQWQDDNGLNNGEVAVLDINAGTWSRILPSGDPGVSGGQPMFPTPRQGSAAFSYPSALVGSSRNASSDTIVFGGQDASGNMISEVWLLRAYAGVITSSNMTWSGYGSGQLQTGINADGSGVRVQYMSQCASMITNSLSSSSPSPTNRPPSGPSNNPPSASYPYNTSDVHKILAPISLAVFQPIFLFLRVFSSSDNGSGLPIRHVSSALLLLIAYGLGIAGLVMSFTTISASGLESGHSPTLKTGHGIAGLIFFVCLYGLIPGLYIIFLCFQRSGILLGYVQCGKHEAERTACPDSHEKLDSVDEPSTPHSIHNTSPPSSPRPRTNSWGPSSNLQDGWLSSDSESFGSAGPLRTFEVVNRPRTRRTSGSWPVPPGENLLQQPTSKSLGDIDWLQRRRRLNAVGELDYVISQVQRAQLSSTTANADTLMTSSMTMAQSPLYFPSASEILFRVLLQGSLLGLCVVTLIALWSPSRAAFAVFLAWTVAFYMAMLTYAWHLRPKTSILAVICSRLFHRPQNQSTSSPTPPLNSQSLPGPYVHHPPYHTTVTSDEASISHGVRRSLETDEPDDVDEDMRQRAIEDEMGRREVSIITIPKRKLWITNPS
ncbi:hypothetical protein L208DRAFT_1274765 [Tricholoma matsutake]|nr:hypothetical protein L208DRAFT_1274765 [Tricholoma matsutake 945]